MTSWSQLQYVEYTFESSQLQAKHFAIYRFYSTTMELSDKKCVICSLVLQEAIQTTCGHFLCRDCFIMRYVFEPLTLPERFNLESYVVNQIPIPFFSSENCLQLRYSLLSRGFCSTYWLLFFFSILLRHLKPRQGKNIWKLSWCFITVNLVNFW